MSTLPPGSSCPRNPRCKERRHPSERLKAHRPQGPISLWWEEQYGEGVGSLTPLPDCLGSNPLSEELDHSRPCFPHL